MQSLSLLSALWVTCLPLVLFSNQDAMDYTHFV
jgi:hypothetical protein